MGRWVRRGELRCRDKGVVTERGHYKGVVTEEKSFDILQRLGKSRSKILWGSLDSPPSYAKYAVSLPAHRSLVTVCPVVVLKEE